MKKNNIKKLEENLSFLLQAINAPISFEISLINQFSDVDDYEVIKTNSELPLYKLSGENKYSEWETIFSLGEKGKTYNRFFDGYREFVSLIEREEPYSYSFVIIHISIDEYSKIGYDLAIVDNTEWNFENNLPTFIDYLIDNFLQVYRSSKMIVYKDIVRKAGETFLLHILHTSTGKKNLNIYNDINVLSALKYEKSDCNGKLIICKDIHDVLEQIDIKFDNPISLMYHKKIRKLLEIAKDDIFLIGTSQRVFGFITQESLEKSPSLIGYQIKIHGALNWSVMELREAGKQFIPIIQCKDSFYQYAQVKFNDKDFCHALKNKFPNADTNKLTEIVKEAIQQKHGTTIVIAQNADEEAKRLASSSFKIAPFCCMKMIKHITSIDGAALIDTDGNCHAIGVILDGKTSETEDISNGARHNSARRYKNINNHCVIVIVSEDGYVTVLY